MLATDEDGGTLDALKFSLASDIIELVVVTWDDAFLQILRDAVGGSRRLWHVPSPDKVSDLLVAGEVGIVVLDVQALHDNARVFVEQIKRQFPDLVLVAAGHRDDETSLAALISSGLVYRFIHKPMSPARAKLFAEAAIKRYENQRRRAAETPRRRPASPTGHVWLIVGAIAALLIVGAIAWIAHGSSGDEAALPGPNEAARPTAVESTVRNAADPDARAGLAEVHERLLARAENALLEERLDEAAAAIETARQAGVDSNRIAFLSAQLAKSRAQIKTAQAQVQQQKSARTQPKPEVEPARDSAPFDVQEPVRADPQNAAALEAQIDPRGELLKNANERLLQDRLIEPANDNAKYFYLTLQQLDPGNPALASVLQDLGTRLAAKARRALILGQLDAARSWLDEVNSIGFASAAASSVQHDLDSAVAQQNFMTTLIPASQLTVLKSVSPAYPARAINGKIEGWVDIEFTVAESGKVKDVVVRATSNSGVFEDAAIKAVSQWRYKPVLRDAKPVPIRSEIRVRFTLP